MKKFIFGALLIVSSVFASAKQPVFADSTPQTTTTEVLTFTESQNQQNVGNIFSFAINNNSIYYVANNTINKFNTTTKINYILPYENVTEIKHTENYVAFTSNNKLILLKNGNEINVPGFNVNCEFFNVFELDNCLHISYVENSKLHYVKISAEQIIDIQRESTLGSQELIANCLDNEFIYLVVKNGTSYNLLKIDTLTLSQTQPNFNANDCSNIELFKQNGETYFLLTTAQNQILRIGYLNGDNVDIYPMITSGTSKESVQLGERSEFTDVKYYNGLVYIADKNNKCIQSYTPNGTELIPNKIEMASVCYEEGYFNGVNDFQIVDSSTLLVADTLNNRIQKLSDSIEVKTEYNQTKMQAPKFYLTSNNQDFWYYFNGKLVTECGEISKEYNIGTSISDIKLDSQNNAYYLDYSQNKLVRILNNSVIEAVLEDLTLNENSKLEILNQGYVILTNNTFKVYNSEFSLVSEITSQTNVTDFTADYFGNLYALTESGIVKFENNNNVLSLGATLSYTTTNLTLLQLNKVTAEFIAFDNSNQRFIKIKNENFVSNLESFEHIVKATELEPLETILRSGKVLSNTYISNYPYNTGLKQELLKDTNVFVLDEIENSYYIMYNDNNSIKYGYILKTRLQVKDFTINQIQKVTVINKNIKLYTLPTILKDGNHSFINTVCQLNSELNIVNFNLVSIDNSDYFAVLTENNKILYVNASDVTLSDTTEISSLPDLNAELIVADNAKVNLYLTADTNSYVILELDASQKVYVANFDVNKEFTYITVIKADKTQVSGYVLTKNLKILDNNPNITSAYILLAVAIIIGLASIIVYVKYKKSND